MLKLNVDTQIGTYKLEQSSPLNNVNVKCNIRLILLMFMEKIKRCNETNLQMKQMIYFVVLFLNF